MSRVQWLVSALVAFLPVAAGGFQIDVPASVIDPSTPLHLIQCEITLVAPWGGPHQAQVIAGPDGNPAYFHFVFPIDLLDCPYPSYPLVTQGILEVCGVERTFGSSIQIPVEWCDVLRLDTLTPFPPCDDVVLEPGIPTHSGLGEAWPNPFNPTTHIPFMLDLPGFVRLAIHDLRGAERARLVEGELPAGEHEALLDGSGWPSGIYLIVLDRPGGRETRRVLLLR